MLLLSTWCVLILRRNPRFLTCFGGVGNLVAFFMRVSGVRGERGAVPLMDVSERRVRHFFPLTSLQIGDLQSYLSHLTLFLALESNKFLILVDNRPWLLDCDARSTHLWQLMVTKYRLSPFANTRAKFRRQVSGRKSSRLKFEQKKFHRWSSLIDELLHRKTAILPVKKLKDSWLLKDGLQHILSGYIVFEVSWDQARGINYLNELQADTSMAVEAKLMKRWEFDSINQASKCISSWFFATSHEQCLLQEYLDHTSGEVFYDANEGISPITCFNWAKKSEAIESRPSHWNDISFGSNDISSGNDSASPSLPPLCGSYKRRKIMKCTDADSESGESCSEAYSEIISSPDDSVTSSSHSSDSETEDVNFEPSYYKDALILFRFNDPDLPFEFRKIIVSDLRLLRLLEYGLPSWVIFLQSYPGFCRLYRPWMCSFARILFVLASIFTVLIGFYDLYKNVPVLKATASRLCGPFFEWIESWEMASRVKYLGTMLFLHHFEKAVAWFLMISRAVRSMILVVTRPMAGPLLELAEFLVPLWNACLELLETLNGLIFSVTGSIYDLSVGIFNVVLWPFQVIVTVAWTVGTCFIYPLFWILREIVVAPIRLVIASSNSILLFISYISNFLRVVWSSISSTLKLASATEVTVEAYEVSVWRSLWDDLFSQVLRAVRSILYGFIAFCTACNRHRLSIYNYLRELLSGAQQGRLRHADSSRLHKNGTSTSAERKPNFSPRRSSKHYKKKLA